MPVVPARVLTLSGYAPGTHRDWQAHRSKRGASGLVSETSHSTHKKPHRGAGLSWVFMRSIGLAVSPGGRNVGKPADSTSSRTVGCTAQGGDAHTKKPRRSGAKFLARVCPSRVKANPPTPYHSRLHSVRPQKKPRRSRAKFDHRACRCDNGKPTDTIPQPVAQRMCRRLITRFIHAM